MTVWIAECLCGPARHCVLGCGYEGDAPTAPAQAEHYLRTVVQQALIVQALNPHCALCGARVERWVYEVRRSRFATLAEAAPELRAFEAAEAALAEALKASGQADDSIIPPMRN
jgi:hypothetical protein